MTNCSPAPHYDIIIIGAGAGGGTLAYAEVGFYWFWHRRMGLEVCWHQGGTCRFEADANTHMLDRNCRTHDVDNLYVVEASFMTSMGAMNPTLTIVANALRVADYLKTRYLGAG